MKRKYAFFWGFFLLLCMPADLLAAGAVYRADSLMRLLWAESVYYEKRVQHFESQLYLKRRIRKEKKNVFMELVPQMMTLEKGQREYLSETLSELRYTAPDIYDRHVVAAYGTIPSQKDASDMIMDYFTMNPYASMMMGDRLISPFLFDNRKYYYYRVIRVQGAEAQIAFYPQYSNTQLVRGKFTLDLINKVIKDTEFEGGYDFIDFEVKMTMGTEKLEKYLPASVDMKFRFRFVGNRLDGEYQARYRYTRIDREVVNRNPSRRRHDLTDHFALSMDTARLVMDSALIARERFLPLTPDEQDIYARFAQQECLRPATPDTTARKGINWGTVGKSMVASTDLKVPYFARVKSSPWLAPMLFGYSSARGLEWKQELQFQKEYDRHRTLTLAPLIGYNFTFKEIDWRLKATFQYWPKVQGRLGLEAGNGFRTYTSDLMEYIEDMDSKDVEKLELNYFNDTHFRLRNEWEVTNGLVVAIGANWYRRFIKHRSEAIDINEELGNVLKDKYITFSPFVRLAWTPGKYYYWNRDRKVTVYTTFPTFSVDYEQGINGVLGSEGTYKRYEVEISHERQYRNNDRFSYRLGYGRYIEQENSYFVAFENFSHDNHAQGWQDQIGGQFHLLDYRWYSSGKEYFRGHLTFESPGLFLSRSFHFMQAERVYVSGLLMHKVIPYLEGGYGFATRYLDIGLFASIMGGKFHKVGARFSFQLFK